MDITEIRSRVSWGHAQAACCKRRPAALALAVMVGSISMAAVTLARQNSVTGTISVGNGYDSNVFNSDRDREDEWQTHMAPELSFVSKGAKDGFALTYAPTYSYNYRRHDDENTQAVSVVADKGISSRWKVSVSGTYVSYDNLYFEADINLSETQNFLRADKATQAEIVRVLFPELAWNPTWNLAAVVSQFQNRFDTAPQADRVLARALLFQGVNGARQRYWTSELTMRSEYQFSEKSSLVLGYRVTNHDSMSGLLADHFGHAPSILLVYQFNQAWRGTLGYELSFDSYDDINGDSRTHHPHLQVDFQISPKDLLYWNYDYRQISYDSVKGTIYQSSQLGWNHNFDQYTIGTGILGISHQGYEFAPDEQAYTLDLGLTRTFEWGGVAAHWAGTRAVASAEDSFGERSRHSWEIGSDLTYRLGQNLLSQGRVLYGQWSSWGIIEAQSPYDQFQVGAGVSYLFKRWYTLSLDYDYSLFDTDGTILDDYTEHLISLKLAAAKELWRW